MISHYTVALAAESNYATQEAGGFAFVQGANRAGVTPTQFANFGFPPYTVPPPTGCESVGLCFSESFDVSSPMSFGIALPLGALSYLNSDGFGQIAGGGGDYFLNASSYLRLDGYTVLDGDGNVVSDAVVTPQNVAGLNLDFTPEPGSWALLLAGLGLLGVWRLRRRRRVLLSVMGLVAVGGAVPVFADSVLVSNSTLDESSEPGLVVEGTPVPYCQDSGTSSAGCATSFYGFVASGRRTVNVNGSVSATAAFGALSGSFGEYNGSSGYFLASFGDEVIVTGGSGAGTLVAHYALSATADSYADLTGNMKAAKLSFVQGSTTTGIVPSFTSFGYMTPLPYPPPAGCEPYGLCFSENFDVTSPVQFGTAFPLGAESYLTSDGFAGRPFPPGYALGTRSSLQLTGYTVLDGGERGERCGGDAAECGGVGLVSNTRTGGLGVDVDGNGDVRRVAVLQGARGVAFADRAGGGEWGGSAVGR